VCLELYKGSPRLGIDGYRLVFPLIPSTHETAFHREAEQILTLRGRRTTFDFREERYLSLYKVAV